MTARRAGPLALVAVLLSVALSACTPFACPAIGWTNSLSVTVTGDVSEVVDVQLCNDGDCSPKPQVPRCDDVECAAPVEPLATLPPGSELPETQLLGTPLPGVVPLQGTLPDTQLPGTEPTDTPLPGTKLPDTDSPKLELPQRSREGNTWTFHVSMSQPEQLTVRVLDVNGSVLASKEVDPEWVRVGGSAQCGGPHEASVSVRI